MTAESGGRSRTSELGAGIRVLHVDDDEAFAELVSVYLEREDDRFEVVTATSVGEALTELDGGIDCVVADYDMPDRNGIEFLETVKSRDPNLPFVLFTGKGSEEIASEAITAGVTDYLQKGTGTEQYALLANRVTNAVESERSRRLVAERKRRLETLIDNLPGVVYRCANEPDWPMEYVEGDCEELTGYAAETVESGEVAWGEDLIHRDDRERAWEAVQSGLTDDGTFELTYRIVTSAGDTEWMWERGQGVYEDGELVALEGFITSITDRKERKRELELKNRRLDEFASIVSHDLRNPLTVAEGHLELAREECDSDHLDAVGDAHDRMRNLVGTLLTIARDGEMAVEAVDLAAVAERCWENVGTDADTLVVDTDRTIRADERRLGRLLENLFRNAVEHGPSTPGTGSADGVTVTLSDLDGGFSVEDDGRGVDDDEAAAVFESGYSTTDDGTGLGLTIVRRIAEDHGWDVTLAAGDAGGARFEVTGVAAE